VLIAREICSNQQKGKGDVKSRTDNHQLKKNQYAFLKEKRYWKVNCPRLKNKESKSEANIAKAPV